MSGTGLLTSDYADPAANAVALGAASPLGAPSPDVLARLRAQQKPTPAAPVAAPKNPETNLTMARQQREAGENPSRDPNAQNPFSTAGGNNQIIDGTWLELMNKYHPEKVQGQTKEQVLAMKRDGDLNNEMAGKYDEDNARFLASNGIAPTPNFINALYRAGPGDGLKLIQAARENPNAMVKYIAPALATPGNNGAGNLSVGQFLVNPYQRGPGAQPGDTPQQAFTISRGNQILSEMLSDQQAGKARLAKIDRDYKPVEVPPPPKPPETDPLKGFSSLAGVFAALASGFSRTPAIAAMNGLAGAMDAAKKSDWETYKANYDQFKTQSALALQAHDQHSGDMRDALEMMTKNMSAGNAMLNATMALSDDQEMRKHQQTGDFVAMGRLQDERDQRAKEWALGQPVYEATAQLTAAMHNYDAAQKGGDPNEVARAGELVQQAENRLTDVKRAGMGGFRTGTMSAQNIAMQRFIADNPGATAQEIQQFALGFKEDAPGVGARKDREVTRKERVDQMNADHRDRMATIAEDRAISTTERDKRLSEERERHDKAVESLAERKQQASEGAALTPDEKAAGAAQAATGMPIAQISPGYGQSAVAERKRLHSDAIKLIMDQTGASAADAGVELANRTIEFQSGKRSSGQLTTMLGATRQAVEQLDFNIDKTKEEMAKLGSSDLSPVINAIARGEEKWTGDPAYSSLFYYMHAVGMESARILSGGQASIAQLNQGAAEEAAKWANVGMTPASFNAVATAMHDEGQARLKTYQDALGAQRLKPGTASGTVGQPQGPKERDKGTSKSGRPIIFRNGNWEYDDASPH